MYRIIWQRNQRSPDGSIISVYIHIFCSSFLFCISHFYLSHSQPLCLYENMSNIWNSKILHPNCQVSTFIWLTKCQYQLMENLLMYNTNHCLGQFQCDYLLKLISKTSIFGSDIFLDRFFFCLSFSHFFPTKFR